MSDTPHERRKRQKREWYLRNREVVLQQQSEYTKSPAGIRRKRRFYQNNKLKICMQGQLFRFLKRLRKPKDKRTQELLGYTIEKLEKRLESTFEDGMTWNNQGEWHIDHIVPATKFNENQIKECFALSNLQAMWGPENISKGNRYSGKFKENNVK